MQTAAAVGISITVTQVGSDPVSATLPVNVSPIDGSKEWQPAVTVDEDGLLYQLRAKLIQARDGSMSELLVPFCYLLMQCFAIVCWLISKFKQVFLSSFSW